jgi:hypothetical protein
VCGKVQQFREKYLDTNIGYRWMLRSTGRDARGLPIFFHRFSTVSLFPIRAERPQMISAAGLDSFGDIGGRKEVLDLCPVHRFPDSPINLTAVS